jgi:uncharacterized membrane protein
MSKRQWRLVGCGVLLLAVVAFSLCMGAATQIDQGERHDATFWEGVAMVWAVLGGIASFIVGAMAVCLIVDGGP